MTTYLDLIAEIARLDTLLKDRNAQVEEQKRIIDSLGDKLKICSEALTRCAERKEFDPKS